MRCGEQAAQKTPPQRRQWCRQLRSAAKAAPQRMHVCASSWRIHSDATVASVKPCPHATERTSRCESATRGSGPYGSVEGTEGFIEQQQFWGTHLSASQCDSLGLTARESARAFLR